MPESQVKPDPDPLTTKSYSVHLLVSTLILMLTLVWAIYDEVEIMRPYKDYQARFRGYYTGFLMRNVKPQQQAKEEAIRNKPDYQALAAKVTDALGPALMILKVMGGTDAEIRQITEALPNGVNASTFAKQATA